MKPIRVLTTAALVVFAAAVAGASADMRPFVQGDPPTAKDALRLALHNAVLPLPRGGSCEGGATSGIESPTIADYLGGFLAELPPAAGVSGIAASCSGARSDLACEITIQRQSGEEVWAWGLRFRADGINGDIRPESLFCTGVG